MENIPLLFLSSFYTHNILGKLSSEGANGSNLIEIITHFK